MASSWRTKSGTAGIVVGLLLAGTSAGIATNQPHSTTATTTTILPTATTPTTSANLAPTSPTTASGNPLQALFQPDPVLHPGLTNPTMSKDVLCSPGFKTSSVRPPTSYTNKLKALELGAGGSITGPSGTVYQVTGEELPGVVGDYELDHLIPLTLGGNPEDPKNLWMEPWSKKGARFAPEGDGAEAKDVVEARLGRAVCAGLIPLAEAQRQIAVDWFAAH